MQGFVARPEAKSIACLKFLLFLASAERRGKTGVESRILECFHFENQSIDCLICGFIVIRDLEQSKA